MVSARRAMEIIHAHAYNEMTHYAYNRNTLEVSERYRAGRMAALRYLTQLSTHYLAREEALRREFLGEIDRQTRNGQVLCPGGYRKGLIEALERAVRQYEKEHRRREDETWFTRVG